MKIKRIEFENFRNFRDHGRIDFPTDGTVTIIYGPNGVGKTTLHQLFQWIIYGEVHFNKTASNKMYNLDYEDKMGLNQGFKVVGSIDFEHPNAEGVVEQYSLHREWLYRKELNESRVTHKTFSLLKLVGDDWRKVTDDPSKVIEQILPSGLSPYFFFDGESMIADLNQKGKDSAKSLRKAIYSIFDLDLYEHAKVHIGTQNSGITTVVGKLYDSRSANSSSMDIIVARGNYKQAQKKVEELNKAIALVEETRTRLHDEIQDLSEKIGSNQSKKELENMRARAKGEIKTFESAIANEMKSYGSTVASRYPMLFLSRVIEEAQYRIGLKIEEETLLPGLRKDLIESLLKEDKCICGNPIQDKEKKALEDLLKLFPPLSYKYIYEQFKKSASRWSSTFDETLLAKHIEAVLQYHDQINSLRERIQDIDDREKQSLDVDALIARRSELERKEKQCIAEKEKKLGELGVQRRYEQQFFNKLNSLMETYNADKLVKTQIEIMEEVYKYYQNELDQSGQRYSRELGESIQLLLQKMLTSTRKVSMSKDFELSVQDSYGDEAKSEGQFAVISFAYIGGIFKLLRSIPHLQAKEFPLILDGPFSKLDVIQRQNVISTIPSYAPQIILFSKDDINSCFQSGTKNNVWTIYSNEERNISYVKQGYDSEVFISND